MDRIKITTKDELTDMPSRARAILFNLLSGIQPAVVLSSSHENGKTNLAVFNSLTHIGSNPGLMGLFFRPLTVERHSYENLKRDNHYVINHLPAKLVKQVHQSSAKYPAHESEAEALGLTTGFVEGFGAPFLKDATISIGLTFEEEHLIKANDSLFVIGRCEWIRWKNTEPSHSGFFDWHQLDPLLVAGLDDYFRANALRRLSYAQATEEPQNIERA